MSAIRIEYILIGLIFAAYFLLRLKFAPEIASSGSVRNLLLGLFCIASGLNVFVYHAMVEHRDGLDYSSPAVDEPLEQLSKFVPDHARVGFVSDIKGTTRAEAFPRMQRFYLTRFAMAPRVVENGLGPDWIVFYGVRFDRKLIPADYVLVRDFGQGLMLFRRDAD